MGRTAFVVALLASVGCRQLLGIDPASSPDDALVPPDSGPCAALTTSCASADVLLTCTAIGAPPTETTCPLGCVADGSAHCGQLVPSGGGAVTEDLETVDLTDVIADGVIDSDSGTIDGAAAGFAFHLANNVGVFRFKSLRLTGQISLRGSRAIALVAGDGIIVEGVIDARGGCQENTPGPGGFPGGENSLPGEGIGGGAAGAQTRGGGGGGHGGTGGESGSTNGIGAAGGPVIGTAEIQSLVGGGGGGGGTNGGGGMNNSGGGGGGAIQLVSNGEIRIELSGGINAGGCGGAGNNCPQCNYGGGGAGGTILIEGRQVTVFGKLAVNGGGGGGAGGDGQLGRLERSPANGGGAGNGGNGGNGAAGNTLVGASAPDNSTRVGGGGGGIGRIRLNTTRDAELAADAAQMSPSLDDQSTATRGPLVIR